MNKSILRKSVLTLCALAVFSCGKDDEPTVAPNIVPVITAQTFNASEDASDTDIFGKVAATDADGDALTFSLKTNSDDLFEITNAGNISLENGKKLDFETTTSHILSIDVTDGTATANAAITITVIDKDENTPPNISAQSFSMTENGNPRGIAAITATDAEDNNNLTFSWPGDTTGRKFEVTASGTINSLVPLNFEEKDTYVIPVTVSDGILSAMADITINITDINDFPEIGTTVLLVSENIDDTSIIGNVTATDEDGDTLIYRITTDTDNLFEISATGDISLIAGKNLDYETKNQHVIKVEVNDGSINPKFDVTIDVTDVNETPNTGATVSTVAGSTQGQQDDTGTAAQFNNPHGVALDSQGNLFVADRSNGLIRKIDANGVVTTFFNGAGTGLTNPTDLVFDSNDNLFITDNVEKRVFGINSAGVFFTFAANVFDNPLGLAVDNLDNVYVADAGKHQVFKVTPTGSISIFAGSGNAGYTNGVATAARFDGPSNIAIDSNGNVFITEFGNDIIRKIDTNGMTTNFAGTSNSSTFYADGIGTDARFGSLTDLVFDSNDNLYVVDSQNQNIRKITPNAEVVTFAGPMGTLERGTTDGPASTARLNVPWGITTNTSGTEIYIGDSGNHRIRKIKIQ